MHDMQHITTDTPMRWHTRPASVNPMDASTWTLARETVPGVGDVSTVWNPIAFAPAYGLPGIPQHFETLVFLPGGDHGDSRTYTTEDEARDGHARMVSALRAIAETLP